MPNTKHSKHNRNVPEDAHSNDVYGNQNHANNYHRERMAHHFNNNPEHGDARFQQCSVPAGCNDGPIDPAEPMDAVRVICNNESCKEGNWMHKFCFIEWERSVLSFLRSCGRARSWSEKQRLQNLWTKKGYDLAYKACDCKCTRGHIRKDLDYIPAPIDDNAKRARKNKKKNDKPMPVVSSNHKAGHNHVQHNSQHLDNHIQQLLDNASKPGKKENYQLTTQTSVTSEKRRGSDNIINNNPSTIAIDDSTKDTNIKSRRRQSITQNDSLTDTEILDNSMVTTNGTTINAVGLYSSSPLVPLLDGLRLRTNSVSSTGSVGSQASSSGSVPSSFGSMSPLSSSPVNGNIFFKGKKLEPFNPSQTGIFRRRQDLSAFCTLPRNKQNPYNIHIEDVQEDEDTRNFVLSNLTTKRMTALRCVLCKLHLPVYDRFPLVDGTLFLSPQAFDQYVVQVIWEGRIQFLNAVCMGCLQGGTEVKCCACKKQWEGSSLVVGTMYTYDIFAAMPCCQKRLTCKYCRRAVVDASTGLNFYSQYSRMIICPYCKANDYHFIRSIQDTFVVKGSICCQQ